MSFDLGIGQIISLTQLSWEVFQNTKQAGDVYSQITEDLGNLNMVLDSLQNHAENPQSLLNRESDGALRLSIILEGCSDMLVDIDKSLSKYNSLSEDRRGVKRFGLKLMFGNIVAKDVSGIRQRIISYTASITAFLGVLAVKSLGKVEESTRDHMRETKGFRKEFRSFADLQEQNRVREKNDKFRDDVTVFTTHLNDDKSVWREFRRKAIKNGYSSSDLNGNMIDLLDYMERSGKGGAMNAPKPKNDESHRQQRLAPHLEERLQRATSTQRLQNYGDDISPQYHQSCLRNKSSRRRISEFTDADDEATIAMPYEESDENFYPPRKTSFGEVNDWLNDQHSLLFPHMTSKRQDRAYTTTKERHKDFPPPMYNQDLEDQVPKADSHNRRRGNLNTHDRARRESEVVEQRASGSGTHRNHEDSEVWSAKRRNNFGGESVYGLDDFSQSGNYNDYSAETDSENGSETDDEHDSENGSETDDEHDSEDEWDTDDQHESEHDSEMEDEQESEEEETSTIYGSEADELEEEYKRLEGPPPSKPRKKLLGSVVGSSNIPRPSDSDNDSAAISPARMWQNVRKSVGYCSYLIDQ